MEGTDSASRASTNRNTPARQAISKTTPGGKWDPGKETKKGEGDVPLSTEVKKETEKQ